MIHIITPSSPTDQLVFDKQLLEFRKNYPDLELAKNTLDLSKGAELKPQNIQMRAGYLNEHLTATNPHWLWAERGGYGLQSLLPHLLFDQARHTPAKVIIGFSDITALQLSLWNLLRWPSLHAPMLGARPWDPMKRDSQLLISIMQGTIDRIDIPVEQLAQPPSGTKTSITGPIQGGCMSVISSLIGTPFQPNFGGSIVFVEDIGESCGQVLRMADQWNQARLLEDAKGLILGSFDQCVDHNRRMGESELKHLVGQKFNLPVFETSEIGHSETNIPIGIGCRGTIFNNHLSWDVGGLR